MYSYYGYRMPEISSTVIVITLVLLVLMIATMWRIFTKAGQKGWKCLIPIYGTYVLWEIGWEGSKFWVLLLGGVAYSVLSRFLQNAPTVLIIVSLAWLAFALVWTIKLSIRLAHRFGKSTAFGVVGLFIFSLIGYLILGWGSADYNAARDPGDGKLRPDSELEADREKSDEYWNKISDK